MAIKVEIENTHDGLHVHALEPRSNAMAAFGIACALTCGLALVWKYQHLPIAESLVIGLVGLSLLYDGIKRLRDRTMTLYVTNLEFRASG